ncbi:MAG: carbohydrate-binding family 9-like protein [Acidobacteriota bacterium]
MKWDSERSDQVPTPDFKLPLRLFSTHQSGMAVSVFRPPHYNGLSASEKMPENTLFTYRTRETEDTICSPLNPIWSKCEHVSIDQDWQGRAILSKRGHNWKNLTRAASVWNENAIFFYFECWYDQDNIGVSGATDNEIDELWDRDVLELFVKPASRDDYYQIEISHLSQWLAVHILEPRVDIDFHWKPNLLLKVKVHDDEHIWRAFVKLPFEPLGEATQAVRPPEVGEAWRLNIYRATGQEPEREYLAWRPTFTSQPDFHVPASFGNLIFLAE